MLVPARANRASRSRHSLSFREHVPRAIAVLLEKKDFVNEIPPRYRSRQEWLWGALTHIMKHMNEAVDTVRKEEHRLLMEDKNDILKGTKYLWLFAEENVPEKMVEVFAFLRRLNLKTGRAWAIKESLRELWSYRRRGWAELYWQRWYFWATHSRLKAVKSVARMIHDHLENVLTYFDHRITNAVSEGLNSKIQTVKKTPMVIGIGSI
jgi:transposase